MQVISILVIGTYMNIINQIILLNLKLSSLSHHFFPQFSLCKIDLLR